MSHQQIPRKVKDNVLALYTRLRQMLSGSPTHYSAEDNVTFLVKSSRQLPRAAVTTEEFFEVVGAILELAVEKLDLQFDSKHLLEAVDDNIEEIQNLLKRSGFYQAVIRGETLSEIDLVVEMMIEAIMKRALEWESLEYLLLLERIQFPCDGFEIAGHSLVKMGAWQVQKMALDPKVCEDFFPDEELRSEGWALIKDGGTRGHKIRSGEYYD